MKDKTKIKISRTLAVRILLVCCVLAAMAFIFSNSLQNGAQSGSRSGAVMEIIRKLFDAAGIAPQYRPTEFLIRKLGHFSEFAFLGFLLLFLLRCFTARIFQNMGWILFAGLLTGVADEGIQMFTAGRSSEVRDVMIDFCGSVFGIAAAVLLLYVVGIVIRRRRRDHLKQSGSEEIA